MPKGPKGEKRPAEVIRNALRLFEALVDEHENGAEFSPKRANGETLAYKIFV